MFSLARPPGRHRPTALSPSMPPERPASACLDEAGPSFAPDGRHVVFTLRGEGKKTSLGDEIEHSAIATVDLEGST